MLSWRILGSAKELYHTYDVGLPEKKVFPTITEEMDTSI